MNVCTAGEARPEDRKAPGARTTTTSAPHLRGTLAYGSSQRQSRHDATPGPSATPRFAAARIRRARRRPLEDHVPTPRRKLSNDSCDRRGPRRAPCLSDKREEVASVGSQLKRIAVELAHHRLAEAAATLPEPAGPIVVADRPAGPPPARTFDHEHRATLRNRSSGSVLCQRSIPASPPHGPGHSDQSQTR